MKNVLLLLFAAGLIAPRAALAQELELINRPANVSGMTGLLFTTAPFTVPEGVLETGVGAFSEKSSSPDYTINQLPFACLTYGLSPSSEISIKGTIIHVTDENQIKHRRAGDGELAVKWNFLRQEEDSSFPALALIIGGSVPFDNGPDTGSPTHWGARLGLSAGSDLELGEHIMGIYADAVLFVRDLSDEPNRDRYGIINAGFTYPISKYRNLQMLLEYSILSGMDRPGIQGGDYSAFTYGLRLVSERFNLSIGNQFIRKQAEGFGNSSLIAGMISLKIY